MSEVFDLNKFRKEKFERKETFRLLQIAMSCPDCKTVTDFFSYYGFRYNTVLSVVTLPKELKLLLTDRLESLWEIIQKEGDVFCKQVNVTKVSELPDSVFVEYQVRLQGVLIVEDYYTSIPTCKIITDFFAQYKIPYYSTASIDRLPPLLRTLFKETVAQFRATIDEGRRLLLARYGVHSESELTTEQYKEYCASYVEMIDQEDHYP